MGEREPMSDETKAAYKRAAEAVISAGSEDRGKVNEQIRSVIEEAKEAWPSMSPEDMTSFFQSQSMLMTSLAHLDVMRLSTAIDLVFRNCTIAAAAVCGAYDLDDDETPKRDLAELAAEAEKARKEYEDMEQANTGMYL